MYKLLSSRDQPSQLLDKLRQLVDLPELDPEKRSLFRGEKEILGTVREKSFDIEKRSRLAWGWKCLTPTFWFKPRLHGSILPGENQTLIFLEGGASLTIKIAWTLLILAAAGIGGVLIVLSYPPTISFDPAHAGSNMFTELALLNVFLALLVALPLIGWITTWHELPFLAARVEENLGLEPVSKPTN